MTYETEISALKEKIMRLQEELTNIGLDKSKETYIDQLVNQLTESELKIKKLTDTLKGKRSPIYIARKGDRIDEALGSFLNNYPEREKLRILFIRESEGNYRFGTKRVFVQVGRANQITVKVGGGFIRVEEFIQ